MTTKSLITETGYLTPEGWRALGFERVNDDLTPAHDLKGHWWLNRQLKLQLGAHYTPEGVLNFCYSVGVENGKERVREQFRNLLGVKKDAD
jgi:hypothetical protein